MRAALYYGPGEVHIENVAEPGEPGRGEVRIRVEMVGLCGTDVSQFRRATMIPLFSADPYSGHSGPVIMGHEVVGVIEAIGADVTGLEIGQRVIPGSGAWCGQCASCMEGRTNICERYFLYGIHAHGGMAERALYPASMCVPVPCECPPEIAVLAQPCAVAVHAVNRAGVRPGQRVAIYGVGGIGSLVLSVLQARYRDDLTLFAVDMVAGALTTAMELAASYVIDSSVADPVMEIAELTGSRGCQVVFEATGVPGVVKQAFATVGRGGRLLQLGIPTYPANLLIDRLVVEEKELIGSNGQVNATDLTQALTLLATTDLASHIQTTVIELDELVESGFKPLIEHRAGGKILVSISGAGV